MKTYLNLEMNKPIWFNDRSYKDLGTVLNNIVYKNQENYEFMLWLIGFTDGEGTFSVEINKKDDMKTGYQVQIAYIITQHGRDLDLLIKIKNYLNNSGEIKLNRGKNGGNGAPVRIKKYRNNKKYNNTII
jgi:hypothetical protein